MVSLRALVIISVLVLADSAHACGWWGDSEMSSRREAAVTTSDGQAVEHSLNLGSMKLPGRMGYGIAVPEPGRAIPYLVATFGQPINRIDELKIFGFRSVIDLGTPAPSARLHRAETEAVEMLYFNIPIEGDMPTREQDETFKRIVLNARNGPLLVYAPRAELIGIMWASYRLALGSPVEFSLQEGRSLGLSVAQEEKLRSLLLTTK